MLFLHTTAFANIFPIALYACFGIALFTLAGMAAGYIFNSQDGAVIASVSLSLICLVFLPVITAPETLPDGVAKIVSAMPFVILESGLRMASIFNIAPMPSFGDCLSLAISFLICLGAIFYFYIKRKHSEI
jgi:hypothetical protein